MLTISEPSTSYSNDEGRKGGLAIFSVPARKHSGLIEDSKVTQEIPGRSSMRFQDGIGQNLGTNER
jgi:hypothetical protein